MLKFTVFGHDGFFGKNLIAYLEKKNKVFKPKKGKYIFKKNLENVIYCLGTHEAHKNPEKALEGNLNILSKVLLNNKFKSFTYLSSIRVYSSNVKTSENNPIIINHDEKDVYFKILKLAAENLCLQKDNPKIRVIRLSNIFGNYFSRQKYFLPTILRNSFLKRKIEITIDKKTKKNYLHANDSIGVILKIIKNGKGRLYNVASNKRITVGEILKLFKKKKKNLRVNFKRNAPNKSEKIINIDKIKKEFKFSPKIKFQKEIINIINDYKI